MIHKCLTSENKCHCHTPNKFLGWKMILLWHQQGWPSLPLKGRWCSVVVAVRSPVFMTLLLYSMKLLWKRRRRREVQSDSATCLLIAFISVTLHPECSVVYTLTSFELSQMLGRSIRDISLWTRRLEVFTALQGQLMTADSQTGGKLPPWAIFEQEIK